jgi:hypothetical protein
MPGGIILNAGRDLQKHIKEPAQHIHSSQIWNAVSYLLLLLQSTAAQVLGSKSTGHNQATTDNKESTF